MRRVRSQASSQPRLRLVEQDAHQLGDGQRRVGVVELDGDLVGQRASSRRCCRRKRRTMSASEQATRKYSCTKRSPWPVLVESSG